MKNGKALSLICLVLVFFFGPGVLSGAEQENSGPLSIAVTRRNIEAIVQAVGGPQVATFSMFKGCILRSDLDMEPGVSGRLAGADAVIWTGFLREAAAINAGLNEKPAESSQTTDAPIWIDVSKDAVRINVPTSDCYGYLEAEFASGDPFFWLNPKNGPVIAQNIAEGLGNLRPEKRDLFIANAEAFTRALNTDIQRWEAQLAGLADLRIFATLCGWQNFTRMGGPRFVVYKTTPGSLPDTVNLMEQLKRMEVQVVILDPGISTETNEAFLEETGFTVLEIPSCIEKIQGAQTYNALFENLVQALLRSADKSASS